MHKNIVLLQAFFDKTMCFIKMDWNLFIFFILQVNPFVFHDFQVLYFLLYHVSFEHYLINDWKNCSNSESVDDWLLESSDSPEKEITFVKRNVLNLRIFVEVDIDDVVAFGDFYLKKVVNSFVWLHVPNCCKN